jgi:hypothetical protein
MDMGSISSARRDRAMPKARSTPMDLTATCSTRAPSTGVRATSIAFVLAMTLSSALHAQTPGDDAQKIVKAMSDYLTAQKTISATYDADIEVITPQLEKIQFTSSGQLLMSRPDKLRVTRTGGYSDVELVFDGATATVLGRHLGSYAQIASPGSIDQLVDRLRDELNVAIPGADLLLARVHDQLMEDVLEAKYIGHGVIDGIECDHLAFRNSETDWQLWVERGARPIPRKYVITSKATAGAPQYTLRIKHWTGNPSVASDAFAFKAPDGAKKVELQELGSIDEVPPGVSAGDKQ